MWFEWQEGKTAGSKRAGRQYSKCEEREDKVDFCAARLCKSRFQLFLNTALSGPPSNLVSLAPVAGSLTRQLTPVAPVTETAADSGPEAAALELVSRYESVMLLTAAQSDRVAGPATDTVAAGAAAMVAMRLTGGLQPVFSAAVTLTVTGVDGQPVAGLLQLTVRYATLAVWVLNNGFQTERVWTTTVWKRGCQRGVGFVSSTCVVSC